MNSIHQYQPPLAFIPPAFNPLVLRVVQALIPQILRSTAQVQSVQVEHLDRLVHHYQQFQQGKSRLLLAFRHPSIDDPAVLFHLMAHLLPQQAKGQGQPFKTPTHCHFLYDRGIPLWVGSWIGWLYSRLGGVPIHRGKLDMQGLRTARHLLGQGQFPFAIAPEGATNGHNDIISPLEPGVAQLGFWAAEDLQKAGKANSVVILPISLRYSYVRPPWTALDRLLTELEQDCGLPPLTALDPDLPCPTPDPAHQDGAVEDGAAGNSTDPLRYQRLYRLGLQLLDQLEGFYSRFYHQDFSDLGALQTPPGMATDPLPQRLQRLLNTALAAAEAHFGLKPKGDIIARCRRLEQAGWDWIYREDLENRNRLSPLECGLADRVAEEAALRLWHMRIVESFVAVTGSYVRQDPSADRYGETTLLVWDLITRLKGGNPLKRPNLGAKAVKISIGEPLLVDSYWSQYQENRRGARQAVADLTQDLQTALEQLMRP
ncbi:lysophospholipid acyltransferase family protein [Prochlorothrix hollandica]|uniref:Glycerol acyltransferase n=1 Tax=Prochlorothrix hollandica PCC 9006 = CALU 1027 TaxID=317619 RepID=A0A0M2PZG0_PROHO|nr:1-acyl-sn-glycerol-3-phosphate acyltransferase [Prochlorothrix hollandica]KKJ01545.1 glycerol acyltransferase [Prochlorothrix hollandica PCC 9006 = CALU 1027]